MGGSAIRDAIQAALREGLVEALCSDHALVDDAGKALPFPYSQPGATGLELLLSLALKWARDSRLPLTQALARVTAGPAAVLRGLSPALSGLGELGGTLSQNLSQLSGTLSQRPDADKLNALVREANEESEQRHAGQLDEAMATFAELILGGSAQSTPPPPTTLPRQQRRGRSKSAKRDNGEKQQGFHRWNPRLVG